MTSSPHSPPSFPYTMQDHHQRMQQRYREGNIPWDDDLPPPEVQAIVPQQPPGQVLDVGCGAGRASIYLAQHGWQGTGVDFVPEAIAMAQERAQAAGVAERITFVTSSVTDLSFLTTPYDLTIDVGCLHGLPTAADEQAYAAEVSRLVRPGGQYLLFARLHDPHSHDPKHRGIAEKRVFTLFADAFTLVYVTHGRTQTSENEWASAWFWMVRRG